MFLKRSIALLGIAILSFSILFANQSDSKKAYLGVFTKPTSSLLTEHLNIEKGQGLTVIHVNPNSPAEKAGLKKNDIILKAGGINVNTPSKLQEVVLGKQSGDKINIDIMRKGQHEFLSAILAEAKHSHSSSNGTFSFSFNDGDNLTELLSDLPTTPEEVEAFKKKLKESLPPGAHIDIQSDFSSSNDPQDPNAHRILIHKHLKDSMKQLGQQLHQSKIFIGGGIHNSTAFGSVLNNIDIDELFKDAHIISGNGSQNMSIQVIIDENGKKIIKKQSSNSNAPGTSTIKIDVPK